MGVEGPAVTDQLNTMLAGLPRVMIVNREFPGMTPSGMKFSTLAGVVGGGVQTPGFIGHSKHYVSSNKFISAEGGGKRIVWMNRGLKEEMEEVIRKIGEREGLESFFDMIADETVAETEEEVLGALADLRAVGVDLVTIGQYLRPTPRHRRVDRYVHPDEFARYAAEGARLGLSHVESGPLVRSSYHAREALEAAQQ